MRDRWAYLLALVPVITDWIDTGHIPLHPREYVTEVVVGIFIVGCVALLHRRADGYRALAETDVLTGLSNRLRFRDDLARSVGQSRATPQRLSLAYVDLDDFKRINDTLGHDAGDAVLRAVGRALRQSVRRDVDHCYRLGGDEFAVLFGGAGRDQAIEALRRAFAPGAEGLPAGVRCSIGVVELHDDEEADLFLRRADRAMYALKRKNDATTEDGVGARLELASSASAGGLGRGDPAAPR